MWAAAPGLDCPKPSRGPPFPLSGECIFRARGPKKKKTSVSQD